MEAQTCKTFSGFFILRPQDRVFSFSRSKVKFRDIKSTRIVIHPFSFLIWFPIVDDGIFLIAQNWNREDSSRLKSKVYITAMFPSVTFRFIWKYCKSFLVVRWGVHSLFLMETARLRVDCSFDELIQSHMEISDHTFYDSPEGQCLECLSSVLENTSRICWRSKCPYSVGEAKLPRYACRSQFLIQILVMLVRRRALFKGAHIDTDMIVSRSSQKPQILEASARQLILGLHALEIGCGLR